MKSLIRFGLFWPAGAMLPPTVNYDLICYYQSQLPFRARECANQTLVAKWDNLPITNDNHQEVTPWNQRFVP